MPTVYFPRNSFGHIWQLNKLVVCFVASKRLHTFSNKQFISNLIHTRFREKLDKKSPQDVLHVTTFTQWLAGRPGHSLRGGSCSCKCLVIAAMAKMTCRSLNLSKFYYRWFASATIGTQRAWKWTRYFIASQRKWKTSPLSIWWTSLKFPILTKCMSSLVGWIWRLNDC